MSSRALTAKNEFDELIKMTQMLIGWIVNYCFKLLKVFFLKSIFDNINQFCKQKKHNFNCKYMHVPFEYTHYINKY